MTKQSAVARVLLALVFAPAGGLLGKAVAEVAAGRQWWPWLLAAVVWLAVSGLVSMAVSAAMSVSVSNRFDDH